MHKCPTSSSKVQYTQNQKCQPTGKTKGNVRDSGKTLGFFFWEE